MNVALNRPAYQKSTHSDPPPYGACHARLAVDGNYESNLFLMSCAHSGHAGTNPWWVVDLGVALHVHSVRLTNRDGNDGTIFDSQC